MHEIFKKLNVTPAHALKVAGIAVLVVVLLSIGLAILSSTFKAFTGYAGFPSIGQGIAPSFGGGTGGSYGRDDYDYAEESMARDAGMPNLSTRNIVGPVPPMSPSPSGDNAEDFEVTSYNAYIETRKLTQTCAAFDELKQRADVIFESAYVYDTSCMFTFKVKHASVPEVLAWVKDLRPKELQEHTYTIKRQIDDYTNEVDVLTKKRASIDETLQSALLAYNEITRLATNTQNADALAQIINSKIALIERMTQERININEQLDRLARAKAEELDRLDYTYFTANIYENKFIDGEAIKDSWKEAIKEFFGNVNEFVQAVTVNLAYIILLIIQWALYAFIVLVVIKYGWKVGKKIWNW